jgi:hypothetical protein
MTGSLVPLELGRFCWHTLMLFLERGSSSLYFRLASVMICYSLNDVKGSIKLLSKHSKYVNVCAPANTEPN